MRRHAEADAEFGTHFERCSPVRSGRALLGWNDSVIIYPSRRRDAPLTVDGRCIRDRGAGYLLALTESGAKHERRPST